MAQSYIVYGPHEAALERARQLACALVCEGEVDFDKKPCRRCRQCRKAALGIHPDIAEIYREKKKDGKLGQDVTVDQMRGLVRGSVTLPNEAAARVFIIAEGDRLNLDAQNALLKLLEEPPEFVAVIIAASSPDRLLETVRSRCTAVTLNESASAPRRAAEADAYLAAYISGDALEVYSAAQPMAAFDKAELREALEYMLSRAAALLGEGDTGAVGAKGVMALARLIKRALEYLEANVSPKQLSKLLSVFINIK